MVTQTPAEQLRAARKAKGWTQETLAHHARVTAKTVVNAESSRGVSDPTFRKLLEAVGLAFEDVVSRVAS